MEQGFRLGCGHWSQQMEVASGTPSLALRDRSWKGNSHTNNQGHHTSGSRCPGIRPRAHTHPCFSRDVDFICSQLLCCSFWAGHVSLTITLAVIMEATVNKCFRILFSAGKAQNKEIKTRKSVSLKHVRAKPSITQSL